jgi:hypothetical protein
VRSKRRKTVFISVLAAVLLSASGVAVAYFTSTGQGTGTATTGSATPFIVSSTADVAGDLVPNNTIGTGVLDTIAYTVTNPSTGSERLASVVISIGNSTGTSPATTETNWTTGASPTCNSSDFSVGAQAVGDGTTAGSGAFTVTPNADLAAGAVYHGTFTLQMIDNGANQNSCEGVAVPVYLAAS